MAITEVELTVSDFDNKIVEQVIANASSKECTSYHSLFFQASKEAEARGEIKTSAMLNLLSAATSLRLELDNIQQPFAPYFTYSTYRSPILDDFSESELAFLLEIFSLVSDAELQARIGDILWTRKRERSVIEPTIQAYLQSANRLEISEDCYPYIQKLERGLQLANFTNHSQAIVSIVSYIETTLTKYDVQDDKLLSIKLLELLQENKQGDAQKYAELSGRGAQQAESKQDWDRARLYWQIQARWYKIAKDNKNEKLSLIRAAETHFEEGQKAVNIVLPGETKPSAYSYGIAAYHIQSAIEAYRRIGGTEQRREELHKTLLDYQQKSVGSLSRISSEPIDISEQIQASSNSVKGKSLFDAIVHLAGACKPPKISLLRRFVEGTAKAAPLVSILPSVTLNEFGKVVARTPAKLSKDPNDVEIAIIADMFRTATMQRQVQVMGVINPIRYQISLEHNTRISDFLELLSNHPFVPPGREYIFAKGLHAGLVGDFLEATHLLAPQIENSVRYLLRQNGIPTSKLDKYGVQNELDLNTTLYKEELNKFLMRILFLT